MKFFLLVLLFFFKASLCIAEDAKKQLLSNKNSETLKTEVFSSKDYYFSKVVYKIGKKFNRKKISRKANFEAIDNFKEFILDLNFKDKKNTLNEWGANTYSKNLISIKNARKLRNIRKKDNYIVIYSFPKKEILINENHFQLNNIISYNSRNHFILPATERTKFLDKINFNDLNLLWKINLSKKQINLNNVLDYVNPIEYQKKLKEIYDLKKIKISYLNKLPSTKYIVTEFINNNNLSKFKKLTYMSSVCSHDTDFLNEIKKSGIVTIDKDILTNKSTLNAYVKLCNGFMSFDKKIVKEKSNKFLEIEKKFKSGNAKIIDEVRSLLEQYLVQNPLSFKAWNYLSAVLRFKKQFDLALIISRVEISIALNNNNLKYYNEALKSYSKAKLNLDKNLTDKQKQFLKSL